MTAAPPYLIGADAGTSSCKVVLIDGAGHILARSEAAYGTSYPRPGWAEQDPEDWYRALVLGIRRCIEAADVCAAQILALSVCGPAHNAVLLDRNGNVLQPVILWSDLRSTPQAEWLEEKHGAAIWQTTYQPVNPSWTLAQLLWIRQHQPRIWERVDHVVIGKDYLTYRLTGAWHTDRYDAMGTQLFDARTGEWSQPICEVLGLALNRLPPVCDATDVAGEVTSVAARATGLAPGTIVAVGSGDSVVEALGAGVVSPGQCIVKLGTAGNVNVVTAGPRPDRRTLTYCHVLPGRWYTITATNAGAAAAKWFREAFGLKDQLPGSEGRFLIDDLAAEVAPGSEGLLFHPFLQGERCPYWNPNLRGDFFGIATCHRLAHFARAVLEGVAFSLRDCMELVRETGVTPTDVRLMGGGARSALWRQIVADVLNEELGVCEEDVTSFGAALLAGVTGGLFDIEAAAAQACTRTNEVVRPDPADAAQYARLHVLYRHVVQALAPVYERLSEAAT